MSAESGSSHVSTEAIDFINNDPYKEDMNNDIPEPETVEKEFIISQVTPMSIRASLDKKTANTVFSLTFLCSNKAEERFFTLTHNYIAETEEEIEKVKANPLYDENAFISKEVTAAMVLENLPNFITDLNFYYKEDEFNPNKKFYMYGVSNKFTDKGKFYKFYMGAEAFTTIAYSDDFVVNGTSADIHNISRAIADGYQHNAMLNTIHFLDDIDKVVTLVPTAEKSTELAVVFNGVENTSTGKADNAILATFDFGKKFPNRKFKGANINKLMEVYTQKKEHFFTYYMFETYIKSEDKDFLVIKARNYDNMNKIFFIDNEILTKLQKLVFAY